MKNFLMLVGLSAGLLANNSFQENVDYQCLNFKTIKDGQAYNISLKESQKRPFEFKIKGNTITTSEKTSFEFRMEKDGMKSYSNDSFILLLQPKMMLGLMPKQAKGKLQYFFTCQTK